MQGAAEEKGEGGVAEGDDAAYFEGDGVDAGKEAVVGVGSAVLDGVVYRSAPSGHRGAGRSGDVRGGLAGEGRLVWSQSRSCPPPHWRPADPCSPPRRAPSTVGPMECRGRGAHVSEGGPRVRAGTIPTMQDPFDRSLVQPIPVRPAVCGRAHSPEGDDPSGDGCSPGRAGHLCDAVEEVGDVGSALVGAQVLDCCGQTLVGAHGVEGGVGVEESVPVGDGGFEVAEA